MSSVLADPPQVLWNRTYPGVPGTCHSLLLAENGYTLGGTLQTEGWENFLLFRTNADGDSLWLKSYGGGGMEVFSHMAPTPDGGFIMLGLTESYGTGEAEHAAIWLLKTDSDGDSVWSRTFGYQHNAASAEYVLPASDGGYLVVGATSTPTETSVGWLIKTDAHGDSTWMRQYRGFRPHSVLQTGANGDYILAGNSVGDDDVFYFRIQRVTSNGDSVWSRIYETGMFCEAQDIAELPNGDFLLSGTVTDRFSGRELIVLRLEADGDTVWQRQVNASLFNDECLSLCLTNDGGCVLAGYASQVSGGSTNLWIVKMAVDGTVEWNTTVSGSDYGYGQAVQQTPDGGFILGGWTGPCAPGSCVWLVKMGLEQSSVELPPVTRRFNLLSSYPNPFNAVTEIYFVLPQEERVHLDIFNVQGRLITTLTDNRFTAGMHNVMWDAGRVPSGIYICRMESESFTRSHKMVLLK